MRNNIVKQVKNNYENPDNLEAINSSVVVLKYIQPARQLLQSNNRTNSIYRKQLKHLPYIFKNCQILHPLGQNSKQFDFYYDPGLAKNIYTRDLSMKINPFQSKNYFHSINHQANNRRKIQKQSINFINKDLVFDSHFQSGNLLTVDKEHLCHKYHLMMQNDTNTFGCTQWFFFRAYNPQKMKATFFINNFYKSTSLYNQGMKILIFSMKKYLEEGVGWIRGGQEIAYFCNKISEKKQNSSVIKQFYSLKFVYNFQYENDEVYFAYSYPYTYSRLNQFLNESLLSKNQHYLCRLLCKTIADNKIFMITITDDSIQKTKKNSIFITSRVHPGQTVSSLMIEGVINFLTSEHEIAKILRSKFIFKIVPMLNPDGVIHGNYRTNLAGIDLNRVWNSTDKQLSPQVYELKKYIVEYNKQCPVLMFCDLHGHSAKKSAFIYGCQNQKLKYVNSQQSSKLFPFMLSAYNEDFLYKSCSFAMQKSKKGTARIQLWKQLKIPNIFTLQASFCSAQNSQYHFRPTDYLQIGVSFCKTIHQYFLNPTSKNQFKQKLKQLKGTFNKSNQNQDDSDSQTDLLDNKTISQLKNGAHLNSIWKKRHIQFKKQRNQIPSATQSLQQKKQYPRRRTTVDRSNKGVKTQASPQLIPKIVTISSKKTIISSIPTKRLIFDNMDSIRNIQPKYFQKRSIFQKVEQNYRGKSTIYRIQRKNLKNVTIQPGQKNSSIFQLSRELDLF